MKPPAGVKSRQDQEFTVDGLSLKVKPLTIQFANTNEPRKVSSSTKSKEATSSQRMLSPETKRAGPSTSNLNEPIDDRDRKSRLLARLQEKSDQNRERQQETTRKLRITYVPSSDSDCSHHTSPPRRIVGVDSNPVKDVPLEAERKDSREKTSVIKLKEAQETTRDPSPAKIFSVIGIRKESLAEHRAKHDDVLKEDPVPKISIPTTFEKSRITFPKAIGERGHEEKSEKASHEGKSPARDDKLKRSAVSTGDIKIRSPLKKNEKRISLNLERKREDRDKESPKSPPRNERKKEESSPRGRSPWLEESQNRKRSHSEEEPETVQRRKQNRAESPRRRVPPEQRRRHPEELESRKKVIRRESPRKRVALDARPVRSPRRRIVDSESDKEVPKRGESPRRREPQEPREPRRRITEEPETEKEPEVIEFVAPRAVASNPEPVIPFFTKVYVFSNHFRCPGLEIDGRKYCCTEQYYMWQKAIFCQDTRAAGRIMATNDSSEIKHIGSSIKVLNPTRWNKMKVKIMLKANYQKYSQFAALRHELFRTAGGHLVEASPTDLFWGVGLDIDSKDLSDPELWTGENKMGELLMAVRDEFMAMPEYAEEIKKAEDSLIINAIEKLSNGLHLQENGTSESQQSEETKMEE